MQGQLIAIVNMVLVVAGSFAFGYKAVEYSLQKPNVTLVNSFYFQKFIFTNFTKPGFCLTSK
jgi:hypothetical protein